MDNINKILEENYLKYIRNKLDSGIFRKDDGERVCVDKNQLKDLLELLVNKIKID